MKMGVVIIVPELFTWIRRGLAPVVTYKIVISVCKSIRKWSVLNVDLCILFRREFVWIVLKIARNV